MDGRTDEQMRTDGRNLSPFYRTSSPIETAAQKLRDDIGGNKDQRRHITTVKKSKKDEGKKKKLKKALTFDD